MNDPTKLILLCVGILISNIFYAGLNEDTQEHPYKEAFKNTWAMWLGVFIGYVSIT